MCGVCLCVKASDRKEKQREAIERCWNRWEHEREVELLMPASDIGLHREADKAFVKGPNIFTQPYVLKFCKSKMLITS